MIQHIYIRLFSCPLTTTHRCWSGVLRHGIFWFLQYLLAPPSRLTSLFALQPRPSSVVPSTSYTLRFDALIFRHHFSRLLCAHRSLPPLHNQPATHSTTRPFYHSSADRNLLDNGSTCSLLLSSHDDQVEPLHTPDVPATFWDLVPFFCAGDLALIFTALLTLLIEDESNESKVLGEQQLQLTSYQRRLVGLGEKERESSIRSQSGY